jgi:hypothetical protein
MLCDLDSLGKEIQHVRYTFQKKKKRIQQEQNKTSTTSQTETWTEK